MNGKHMEYMKYMRRAYDRIMTYHVEILGTGSSVYKYEVVDNKYVLLNDRSDMIFTILGISESEVNWNNNIRKKEIILLHEVTMRIFLLTIEIERIRLWGPEIAPMFLDEDRMYVEELQDIRNPTSSWDREGSPIF